MAISPSRPLTAGLPQSQPQPSRLHHCGPSPSWPVNVVGPPTSQSSTIATAPRLESYNAAYPNL
ncbi:hypothetical protein L484_005733 [Morus notabilis]|uniref:Uncharacterized protein n=1 Tax=Morus notabilis TaxID=981085 RepID=W9QBT8_9ROSA|nr:hypothetical protein L484_005733 [Morus notabilis]